jgi:hypothetical protein
LSGLAGEKAEPDGSNVSNSKDSENKEKETRNENKIFHGRERSKARS